MGGGINGGYLMAIVGRALRTSFPTKPDPLALSATFVSAATPGPAEVQVRTLREGGKVAFAAADLVQHGAVRISALATYGDLDRAADDVRTTADELVLPPIEECRPGTESPPEFVAIAPLIARFETHYDPAHMGWATGEPDFSGELSAWFRLEDGRDPDPLSLLMTLDALPPVVFTHGLMGWSPTLELTAHVRAKPAPGWLKVRHASRNIAGGMFEEDCEIWDSAGRLVAQSRQLAMTPTMSPRQAHIER